MSRAVPANLGEYLFTSSNPYGLRIDGKIMPLRDDADPSSLDFRNCIRGVDLVFLHEAVTVRGGGVGTYEGGTGGGVRADVMDALNAGLGRIWSAHASAVDNDSYEMWSPSAPVVPAGVLPDGVRNKVARYLEPYFSLPSRRSAGDAGGYVALDSTQVANLFADVGQLNYGYTKGATYCPYGRAVSTTLRTHYVNNATGDRPPDSSSTSSSWLWYDADDTTWRPGRGYPNDVSVHRRVTTAGSSLSFSLSSNLDSSSSRLKTCVEVWPWAVLEVSNSWSSDGDEGYDADSESSTVAVPLTTGYQDMLAPAAVPAVTPGELSDAVSLAFAAAGLKRTTAEILASVPPKTGDIHSAEASSLCRFDSLFYLFHFLYCSLQSVGVQ